MTMTDPVADMLTRIRNANVAFHDDVVMPSSKLKVALAKILEQEGYISGSSVEDDSSYPRPRLRIAMKYTPDRKRTISGLRRVQARPAGVHAGRPAPRVLGGMGHRHPVHQQGLMTDRGASATSAARSCARSGSGAVMSRVGKEPITIPSGVEVNLEGRQVVVKGPNGTLEHQSPETITVSREGDTLVVSRPDDERENRALHGLTRSLVQNMVVGVSQGFSRELEIVGVGYRAQAQGPSKLELQVGFSHPVRFEAPEGVTFEVPQPTRIVVRGADKQLVGQVAADVRKSRPPEPYKGKGIRYADEHVQRKAGKSR
jgi:large subunit ribosomal protein L6